MELDFEPDTSDGGTLRRSNSAPLIHGLRWGGLGRMECRVQELLDPLAASSLPFLQCELEPIWVLHAEGVGTCLLDSDLGPKVEWKFDPKLWAVWGKGGSLYLGLCWPLSKDLKQDSGSSNRLLALPNLHTTECQTEAPGTRIATWHLSLRAAISKLSLGTLALNRGLLR